MNYKYKTFEHWAEKQIGRQFNPLEQMRDAFNSAREEIPIEKAYPIIGQECICPDGLGRVSGFDNSGIFVKTYIKNRECRWADSNVELLSIKRTK